MTPEKQVAASIGRQILGQKKDRRQQLGDRRDQELLLGKIKYQSGFTPSPDPCASTTTNATTTG